MLSSHLDSLLDDLLVDRNEKTEPKPEASGGKIKQEIEPESEVDWDDVEDEWFEFGTNFLIF